MRMTNDDDFFRNTYLHGAHQMNGPNKAWGPTNEWAQQGPAPNRAQEMNGPNMAQQMNPLEWAQQGPDDGEASW